MYGTAFDAITKSRHLTGTGGRKGLSGLAYLIPNPTAGSQATIDVPMACGVDPSGNAWVQIGNQYFYDALTLLNYANSGGDPNYTGTRPSQGIQLATTAVLSAVQGLESKRNIPYAYWGASAFGGGWLTFADLVGALKAQGVPFTAYQPPPPPQAPGAAAPQTLYPLPPPSGSFSTTSLPPGFATLQVNAGIPRAWPIYGTNPIFHDGMTSFDFAKGFYSLAPSVTGIGGNSVGLDTTKLSAGIYAYKETDLGAITGDNGRVYELFMLEIYDSATQTYVGTFYETVEGGGGGLLISDPLALASRIITDISTMGSAEIVRATAKAVGVPDSTITLATEAYAAAAIAVATVGAITIASAPASAVEATAEISATGSEAAAATVPASVAADGSVVSATSVAATGAGAGASTGGGVVAAASTAVGKAVVGTVLATGATALSTELKKITGQLPKAAQAPIPAVPVAGAQKPSTAALLVGGIAALLYLKN